MIQEYKFPNIFDQYDKDEDRLTHAFLSTLNEDRKLLGDFFSKFLKRNLANKQLKRFVIQEQAIPERRESVVRVSRNRPDGWIYQEDSDSSEGRYFVIFENKVSSSLKSSQLMGHIAKARDLKQYSGSKFKYLLVITARDESRAIQTFKKKNPKWRNNTISILWEDIFSWLSKLCSSSKSSEKYWAKILKGYLQILEDSIIERGKGEFQLTNFTGIPFDKNHPYEEDSARVLVRKIREEILANHNKIKWLESHPYKNKNQTGPWDVLRLKGNSRGDFRQNPHITIELNINSFDIYYTFPNEWLKRHKISNKKLDKESTRIEKYYKKFEKAIKEVNTRFLKLNRRIDVTPNIHINQRRGSGPYKCDIVDSDLIIDTRTVSGKQRKRYPKYNPHWLRTAWNIINYRNDINLQIQFGSKFDYSRCSKKLNTLQVITECVEACKIWGEFYENFRNILLEIKN